MTQLTLILGTRRYAASRYRGSKMTGGKLAIKFDEPRELCMIEGAENIDAAIEEIRLILGELERERMGSGWTDEDDDF